MAKMYSDSGQCTQNYLLIQIWVVTQCLKTEIEPISDVTCFGNNSL